MTTRLAAAALVEGDRSEASRRVADGLAVWKITPLKLSESKYILQSASKGGMDQHGNKVWECLTFEEQGAATNPSRYNWGNGDDWCGVGNWEGQGKAIALMDNKQAVFILTFMQAVEEPIA